MWPPARWACSAVVVGGLLFATGCAAAGRAPAGESAGASTAAGSPAATLAPVPSGTPSIPADGISLAELGFLYGPTAAFSVPRTAVITTRVDQPNAVTLVMTAPPATDLAAYYRRALPAAGFTITEARPEQATLTFTGAGWHGVLTGSDGESAVLLRPG